MTISEDGLPSPDLKRDPGLAVASVLETFQVHLALLWALFLPGGKLHAPDDLEVLLQF